MVYSDENLPVFRRALLGWYADHARDLPWRVSGDPYHVWLSEIMLQQTRVDQAYPYFQRFIAAFPTVEALAEASLDDVLTNWEGLGYYSRARNLHKAAQKIASEHAGALPDSYDAIRALPGIGPYTAAAILSIAFQKLHGVVDGNVIRVLSRLTCNEADPSTARTRRLLQEQSDVLVDPKRPGDFNQAMMELGATICKPRKPACTACPVSRHCCAFATNRQENFPRLKKKLPVPHYDIAAGIVFNKKKEVLIQRRPENGLLGGLWEFPGIRVEQNESFEAACHRAFQEDFGIEISIDRPFTSLSHAYSHFKITLHAFFCSTSHGDIASRRDLPIRWTPPGQLQDIAFPRVHRKIIDRLTDADPSPTLFD